MVSAAPRVLRPHVLRRRLPHDDDAAFDEDRDNCGGCGVQCADSGCGFLASRVQCNNGDCEGP